MSFIDSTKAMAVDNPNFFKIGDIAMFVPVQNIEVTRHENFQSVSYLRDMHAMKINTGRSIIRVNITFPILVDKQLRQLQSLVAMTRVTPFVPVQNAFLQAQIQIYDTPPEAFNQKPKSVDPNAKAVDQLRGGIGDLFTSDGAPTFLEALPMAIMGMSVTMGGDSGEIAECSMSFTYWNPLPWFGIDLQYWKDDALLGLHVEYSRYLTTKIDSTLPATFDTTTFRWWDIRLYSELTAIFTQEMQGADAESAEKGGSEYKTPDQLRADENQVVHFDGSNAFDNYLQTISKRISIEEFMDGIANAESGGGGRTAVNPDTKAAGKYQITKDTFAAIFFDGADTVDGVPVRDKLTDQFASFGIDDPWISDMTTEGEHMPRSYYEGGQKPLSSDDKFAEWFAKPHMSQVQDIVMQEYSKGLYKKHNGDAVKAGLEYFLGASDAQPYINNWEKHGVVQDWRASDAHTLGTNNVSPRKYIHNMTKALNDEPGGYSMSVNRPLIDQALTNNGGLGILGTGPIMLNRRGESLQTTNGPVISPERRNALQRLGWEQIAVLQDGRPDPSLRNPLFVRTSAHIVDLAAGGILDAENQIVTSITIAFQNRFASLPIQGWPYPALQHMGSVDSELRMTIACLSDSQQYNRLKQAQHMLHAMATRARKYRADIHDSREIILISKMAIQNKLINSLGIKDVIVTDLSVQIDPESPNMARGEIIMSESALDPNKETLQASVGKNDQALRVALREQWLRNERYLQSVNPEVQKMGVRLRNLQKTNDRALALNRDVLFKTDTLRDEIATTFAEDEDFRKKFVFTREDEEHYRKEAASITSTTGRGVERGLLMHSPLYVTPTARVVNKFTVIDPAEFNNLAEIALSIDPDVLFAESLGTKLGNWLEGFYRKSEHVLGGDPRDIDKIKGDAIAFLDTSFGKDLYRIWAEMQQRPSTVMYERLIERFFDTWVSALHEWYNKYILEEMLVHLYQTYERDATFNELATQTRAGAGVGIYKDLFLDSLPDVNPYAWLDETVIAEVADATGELIRQTEARIDVMTKEYTRGLRDDDGQDVQALHDASTFREVLDVGRNSEVSRNFGVKSYQQGIQAAAQNAGKNARNALRSLRFFSAIPFTMRRAFPAFRLYFLEEDNQGIFKRFDDFYNYNAITDIQMVKYKDRPSTMIVTMTNLFGHLDAKTFDDMADRDDKIEAQRQANNDGKLATTTTEKRGREYTVDADGSFSPLREIMLKPGTKVVMKLGYDNNPDKIPTTFAGQVTEVSGGEIITIVCQDWTSELFAGVTSGDENIIPTDPNIVKKLLWTSSTWDIQGNVSARTTLDAVLRNRSVQHFGHWQVGKNVNNSNYFGYQRESNLLTKPFDGQLTKWFREFSGGSLLGRTRANMNIWPQTQPFYKAWGMDMASFYPERDEARSMSLWEIIQLQKRLLPDHVVLVRPYGQGDATLYLGPPWGAYMANAFTTSNDQVSAETKLTEHNRELFRHMIHNGATIPVAGYKYVQGDGYFGNIERQSRELLEWKGDGLGALGKYVASVPSRVLKAMQDHPTSEFVEMPIADLIMDAAPHILKASGRDFTKRRFAFLPESFGNKVVDPEAAITVLGELNSDSPNYIIDLWYDAILSTMDGGGIHDDGQEQAILIDVQAYMISVFTGVAAWKAYTDPDFDKDGAVRAAIKPVRRWHMVTSKHHIIANNIQLNNNFANEVRAGDNLVRYDPELTERRTRHADREMPASLVDRAGPRPTIYLTALLAEEMRTMYRGEIIITGNSEIEPHDILFIFDDVRHIMGAVEVAKVNHIFNQEMGFITIIEPHLIVEQGDYGYSTALSAAMTTMTADFEENQLTDVGRFTNKTVGLASAVGANLVKQFTGFTGVQQAANYIISQMFVPHEARNHPLTIFPLVKRTAPWLAGIEGASGRGMLGALNQKLVRGLKGIRDATKILDRIEDFSGTFGELAQQIKEDGSLAGLTDPTVGKFSK